MKRNYRFYLGSACNRNYEESLAHVQAHADYLYENGYGDWYEFDYKKGKSIKRSTPKGVIKDELNIIESGIGNPLGCMWSLSGYYTARASLNLLTDSNVEEFKYNAYIGAKLRILSSEEPLSWISGYNTSCLFLPIMSDNPDLIHFLIKQNDYFLGEYERANTHGFFLKNTLLALSGNWSELKTRSETFLNESQKQRKDEVRVPDHEFYIALCNKDVEGMQIALNKLLEPKLAKKAVYDNNVWFDFYLQMQVLMYAKISSIHRFELGIDSPYAPKELIEYKPLERYEDPYDFMKEFDYSQPQQVWIDKWNEKMRLAKERGEIQKKKGFLTRLFGK